MKVLFTSLLSLVLATTFFAAHAQDPQFSQGSFATPLYLNPAFTGSTSQWRASALYRTQWVSANNNFKSIYASVDHNLSSHHNGLGLRVMRDEAGDYITNMVTGHYAHHVAFGGSILSMGLGVSYVTKGLNPANYVFRDQLRIDAFGTGTSQETFGNLSFNLPSFSGGLLFKSNNQFWFGIAADHINSPAQDNVNGVPLLPMKLTVHGGVNLLSLNKHGDVSQVSGYPNFIFRKQGPFMQLDLGINISKDAMKDGWGYVVGGAYRGMMISSSVGDNRRQDALLLLGGLTFGDYTFTYSYDITISKLLPYSGGTHEISLIFENNLNKSDSRKGGIANPIYLERFPKKGKKK